MESFSNNNSGEMLCGKRYISESIVLSATHCLLDDLNPSDYSIAFGTHAVAFSMSMALLAKGLEGTIVKEVQDFIKHPKFDFQLATYDFSLFFLKTPARISRKNKPCLPPTANG